MFDIAWSEMVLIGAVALVVIGPKDLPKALRTVGQTVGRIRRMASEFQGQFNEAMREAELADLKKQVEDVGGSVSSALNNDFKPIDTPRDFDPAKPEAPKPDEAALKEAEAKLASLPPPEPLPPVQIDAPKLDFGNVDYAESDGESMLNIPVFVLPSSGNDELKITAL